jgi:hypothetical protein
VLNQTIQNCFIKSTVTSRTGQVEGSLEALQLGDLYQNLTDRLIEDSQEVMSLDDFLDPSDENHASEPDLSDIILDLSCGDGDGDSDSDGNGDGDSDDEDISGPPPDLPSSTTVINSM